MYWRDEIKAQLDEDVALGVIEKSQQVSQQFGKLECTLSHNMMGRQEGQ